MNTVIPAAPKRYLLIWCCLCAGYAALATLVILVAPAFAEALAGFGFEPGLITAMLLQRPWLFALLAALLPAIKLLFVAGLALDLWPDARHRWLTRISLAWLLTLLAMVVYGFYGPLWEAGGIG